jgi:uncharacterized protein YciI
MQTSARLAALVLVAAALGPALQGESPAAASPAAQAAPPSEMVQYYMVFLRRGPAWTTAITPETTKVNQGHRANIERLTTEGTMVVAGPFDGQTGDRALAGIFILRVGSMDEAKAITDSDPAVKAGRFVYEIAPWWGPKSLRY